jgi:hypothetical protein
MEEKAEELARCREAEQLAFDAYRNKSGEQPAGGARPGLSIDA